MSKDINHALVESKRPPMYTAMKYWGKKPHNIWSEYIKNYTDSNELILDPFSGSALAAFEAVKLGRRAIAFDINPLTSFLIEVYSTNFNISIFTEEVKRIIKTIEKDDVYQTYYNVRCDYCGNDFAVLQHFKWDNSQLYEVGVICNECKSKTLRLPSDEENRLAEQIDKIILKDWFPKKEFYDSPSFSRAFKKNIGGTSFCDIWTKRNLYILSKIYNMISEQKDENLKKQLMFGFIQILHLSSKMCVPRRSSANRGFSTSWGRAAYICSKRQMEMNPLMLFESNTIGKQSVKSALTDIKDNFPKGIKIKYIDKSNKLDRCENYDIEYGIVDINTLSDYLDEESIDFIITDPPYGGLVQYIDLSHIWLIWLEHFDTRFKVNVQSEITIKKNIQNIELYQRKFTNGIANLYRVLKPNGKIVFTFHNKDLIVWNSFLTSISRSGFKIEKVIHQQNRRSGESNVSNPYGTSASDFYIRCIKSEYVKQIRTTKEQFENFVVDRAVNIILARNEPTPYQILLNGLLSEISKAGFDLEDFDESINTFLEKHVGKIFEISTTTKSYGNLWWVLNTQVSKKQVIPLSDRVDTTVKSLFKQKISLTIDEVLAEVFIKFPNGLTPDIRGIDESIKKFAYKSGERWIYNGK